MQVFMMPDYRSDNPYQSLLEQALRQQGVQVNFPVGYRRIFPVYRAAVNQPDKVDVLHLHWLGPYLKGTASLVRWIYAIKLLIDIYIVKLSGVRVVWTVHNLISHDTKNSRLELWIRRRLAGIADQLIVHNQSSKVAVSELYQISEATISVIPIGHYQDVYADPVKPIEARQYLNLPTTGNIYLWQGVLRPYKGVESLLTMWVEHQNIFKNHTLVIAGPVFDNDYGDRIAALVMGLSNVHFLPEFIEDNKLHLFFSAATVVVLPFKQILTSSSLMLAMSYNKPVIAPRIGGIPETLGEAGQLLYEPEEDLGLLHAMKESMETDLAILCKTVEQVCTTMNWPNIAQKTYQLYHFVLRR